MKTNIIFTTLACTGVIIGLTGLTRHLFADSKVKPASSADPAEVSIARGKHLIEIGGCNDCHTPGFMERPKVPETEWLTGVPVGWRGPWGTSYPANLRRQLASWEDAGKWITMVRSRSGLPPMPWLSLHAMTDDELRSIHTYIRSLPYKGDAMPMPVPPEQEPATPYLNLAPVMPPAKTP